MSTTTIAAPLQTPLPKATAVVVVPPPVTPSPRVPPAVMSLPTGPQLFSITVEQYEQMGAAGILTENDRVELLNGLLVSKMTLHPPHATALGLLRLMLPRFFPDGWWSRVQDPIVLDVSMPEPDFVIVRGDPRSYTTRHPRPADIGLVIEVADSSLAYDRGEKLRAYAANGIVEYWIVNLVDARVEVYTQPSGPTVAPSFGNLQSFASGQAVPLTLDGVAIASIPVADILP